MLESNPSSTISLETTETNFDSTPSSLLSTPASELSLDEVETPSLMSSSAYTVLASPDIIDWEPLLLLESEIIDNNSKLREDDSDYVDTSFLLARADMGHNPLVVTDNRCDNVAAAEAASKEPKLTEGIVTLRELLDSHQDTLPFLESKPVSEGHLVIWDHIINNFPLLASKVPHVVAKLVHEGIPPALRGNVWKSFIFSEHPDDNTSSLPSLSRLYDSLAAEWTPDLKLIAKDLYRTFPDVEIFKERDGPGQTSLGKVLRAYSAYDIQLGYCQGLAFLVGPLLMHMNDSESFCALVKLMELSDLRLMFVPDMIGLHVKLYQFNSLLKEYFPDIVDHFGDLGVMPAYSSKWFLSFFATTCPPCMLVRVFDLIMLEGITETMMRTALAIIHKNAYMLLNMDSDEEILTQLLSQSIFDSYGYDGDSFVKDILRFNSVTTEKLKALENDFFMENNSKKDVSNTNQRPSMTKSPSTTSTKSSTTRSSFSSLFSGRKSASASASTNDVSDTGIPDPLSCDRQSVNSLNSFEAVAREPSSSSISQSLPRRRSSITSMKTTNKPNSMEYQEIASLEEMRLQLEKAKRELEREKNNRRMDRFSVLEYLNSIPADKTILYEQFDISVSDGHRNSNGLVVESRHHRLLSAATTNSVITEEELDFSLENVENEVYSNEHTVSDTDGQLDSFKDDNLSILDPDNDLEDGPECSYCDQLRKEILSYKADLVLSKQTVEELKNRLRIHATSNGTGTGKKVFSGSQPQILQTKRNLGSNAGGWNLWSNGAQDKKI